MLQKIFSKNINHQKILLAVSNEELEKDIFSTGFYRQKAKSIKACCHRFDHHHKGKVPNDFETLIKLPGVGRKTASVIAGNAFGIPAIAVDTHVKRLSNLLGFIKSEDAEKIEYRLKELLPEKDWVIPHIFSHHTEEKFVLPEDQNVWSVFWVICVPAILQIM